MTTEHRPLYFDCDTGVDDAVSLGYLLASPEIDLVGIGTVSGNVSSERAAENTLALLEVAGRDIPVAVGEHDHLTHAFDGGAVHVHGESGLGNVQPAVATRRPVQESAVEMILRLSHEFAGELEILAVGPFTNLAVALAADPTLPQRVKQVTVMGGAALVPGNVSPVAEANIANDPEAAQAVVEAGWPVVFVPLDVTMQNVLEESDRERMLAAAAPLTSLLGRILDLYFDFYTTEYGRRSSALHDPLAAAIAVGGVHATNAPAVPTVVDTTAGPGRGQTIFDLRGQRLGPIDRPGSRVRVVLATDRPLAPELLERLGA
jgi:purine nucleosidase